MRRYFPALLVIVSAGILVAALLEINTRDDGFFDLGIGDDDEPSALATPSPTPFGGIVSTPSPTPAETMPLTPPPDDATGAQTTPAPTAAPTETPTPTPTPDVGGVSDGTSPQARGEPMPVTGGGAVSGGLLLLAASALLGGVARIRLR